MWCIKSSSWKWGVLFPHFGDTRFCACPTALLYIWTVLQVQNMEVGVDADPQWPAGSSSILLPVFLHHIKQINRPPLRGGGRQHDESGAASQTELLRWKGEAHAALQINRRETSHCERNVVELENVYTFSSAFLSGRPAAGGTSQGRSTAAALLFWCLYSIISRFFPHH